MRLNMNSRNEHKKSIEIKDSEDVLCIVLSKICHKPSVIQCFYKSQPGSQKVSGKSSADKTPQQIELSKPEPMNIKENHEIAKKNLQIQELQNR